MDAGGTAYDPISLNFWIRGTPYATGTNPMDLVDDNTVWNVVQAQFDGTYTITGDRLAKRSQPASMEPKMDRVRPAMLIAALVVDVGRRLPRRCGSAVPPSARLIRV